MQHRTFLLILKSFPIETYVIFIPSLLLLSLVYVGLGSSEWSGINEYHFLLVLKKILFNNPTFGNIFVYPLAYLIFRYIFDTLPLWDKRNQTSAQLLDQFFGSRRRMAILCTLYWIIGIFAFCYLLVVGLGLLFHMFAPPEIAQVSREMMQIDHALFGGYPVYALQFLGHIPLITPLIVYAYLYTPLFLGIIFLMLLFFRVRLFRHFFLTTTFAFFLCFPLWYMFPALTPNEMYRYNLFALTIPSDIKSEALAHPAGPLVETMMTNIETIWIDPDRTTIAVSTMPSMHVIWGIEVALFGYLLIRRYALFFALYCCLNILGTMLLLQHYAIDVIVGALVGAVSLLFAYIALRYERRYMSDNLGIVHALGAFARDAVSLRALIEHAYTRLLRSF